MEKRSDPILTTLARKVRLARTALAWERLWPSLWPATATAGAFAALAVWGAFEFLPGWLHLVVLAAFAAALVWLVWRAASRFRWPDTHDARRRVETESDVRHRPLASLSDTLKTPVTSVSLSLWRAHQRRALDAVRRMRVGWPRAGLAVRDPRSLRVAIALVLIVGFIVAGGDWQRRLAHAVTPNPAGSDAADAELAAWIAPPSYTAVPPVFLTPPPGQTEAALPSALAGGGVLQVPEGSTFYARVHGGGGVPKLLLGNGDAVPFSQVDTSNFQISGDLADGGTIAVTQGRARLGEWRIEILADRAPTIEFSTPVVVTRRMALQVHYGASDDYGLDSARVVVRRIDNRAEAEFKIPMPGIRPRNAAAVRFLDLTPHPWAGLMVDLVLKATDGVGQSGRSEAFRMRLPEREFTNPVAQAIIEQRRNLATDPENREPVANALEQITETQYDAIDDFGAYLSIRSTISRLRLNPSEQAVVEVIDQLWDTALALEDGALGIAERGLRSAQQALQDALARSAPDDEIERLVQELREAMQEYLTALAEQARQNPQTGQQPAGGTRSMRDLMEMLDRAAQLNEMGAREAAMQLLSELQQMLENLRAGAAQGQGPAEQALQELNELMQQQQQLMDQTFQQDQRGAFGDSSQLPQPGRQQSLAERLQQMMEGMGDLMSEVPDAFGRAAQAMEDAAQSLRQLDAGAAFGQQTEALSQLRQGAAQVIEQLMQQLLGDSFGPQNGQFPDDSTDPAVDPLGRPLQGLGADISTRVQVPDGGALQRARAILDELLRRAGERGRPLLELDYLERLLRRF